jgi:hypothetical protein
MKSSSVLRAAFGKFVELWLDPEYVTSKEDEEFVMRLCMECAQYVSSEVSLVLHGSTV